MLFVTRELISHSAIKNHIYCKCFCLFSYNQNYTVSAGISLMFTFELFRFLDYTFLRLPKETFVFNGQALVVKKICKHLGNITVLCGLNGSFHVIVYLTFNFLWVS